MKTYDELITNLKELIRIINSKYTDKNRNSDQLLLCEIKNLLEMSNLNTDKWKNNANVDFKQIKKY